MNLSTSHRSLVLVLVGTLLLTSFQNCGKSGFDGDTEGELDFSSSSSKTSSDPFAFKASFDQISYNSCFDGQKGLSPEGKGYFTIRAGAYEAGSGVNLDQRLSDFVRKGDVLRPIPPAQELTTEQIKSYISRSFPSEGASLQMAVRELGKLQSILFPAAHGEPVESLDFSSPLGDLTDDRWLHPIVANGPSAWTRFFTLAPEPAEKRKLESTLTFHETELMSEDFRKYFNDNKILALTFRERRDQGHPTEARAPAEADRNTVVYGRGYRLRFSRAQTRFTACAAGTKDCDPTGLAIYNHSPTNIMTAVQEVDLERPAEPLKQQKEWKCNPDRRYTIVRLSDQKEHNLCPPDPFGTVRAERREYEILRRHFPANKWSVNMRLRCVVPLEGGCYDEYVDNGTTQTRLTIAYDQRRACFQNLASYKSQYGTSTPGQRCPHVISICVKE